jgi:hypothetical protein
MAKSRKHMHKKRKGKRVKRSKRFMRGGNFTEQELTVLNNSGFSQYQIQRFTDMGLTFEKINQKMQEIMGEDFHGNLDDFADAVEEALLNEHMNQGVPHDNHMDQVMPHDNHMDMDNDDDHMDLAGPMNLNELDVGSDYAATDSEADSDDDMNGGRRRKRTMKKRKGRKTRKTGRKNGRRTRRQKGGVCYGNGVGANSYDPNFSIYNTRELTLFPYRPTN